MRLNDKQQQFVAEYLRDFNATQAAIRAGYSPKTAGAQAHKLLKKAEIRVSLTEQIGKALTSAEIDTTNVLREVGQIAFVKHLEGFITPRDKLRALEILMKYLGLLVERHELKIDIAGLTDDQAQALELLTRTGVLPA